jgi:hypothetical protein
MATVKRVISQMRRVEPEMFPSQTGTVYVEGLGSEDGVLNPLRIYVDDASLTIANFNAAPVGSVLINTNGAGTMYFRGASGWAEVSTE